MRIKISSASSRGLVPIAALVAAILPDLARLDGAIDIALVLARDAGDRGGNAALVNLVMPDAIGGQQREAGARIKDDPRQQSRGLEQRQRRIEIAHDHCL